MLGQDRSGLASFSLVRSG